VVIENQYLQTSLVVARNLFKVTEGGALWLIRGQHEWSPSNYGVEPTIIINRQRFWSLLTFISTSLNIHSQLDPILAKIVYYMYCTLSHEDVYKFYRQPLFNMVIMATSPTPRAMKTLRCRKTGAQNFHSIFIRSL
jgi:hypothetical protein